MEFRNSSDRQLYEACAKHDAKAAIEIIKDKKDFGWVDGRDGGYIGNILFEEYDKSQSKNGLPISKELTQEQKENDLLILKALLENPNFLINENHGGSLLTRLIINRRPDMVEELLKREDLDVNINVVSIRDYGEFYTPILSALNCSEKCFDLLLERKDLNINAPIRSEYSNITGKYNQKFLVDEIYFKPEQIIKIIKTRPDFEITDYQLQELNRVNKKRENLEQDITK